MPPRIIESPWVQKIVNSAVWSSQCSNIKVIPLGQAERIMQEAISSHHQELQKSREEERAFILQELALRDIPDEHGHYPFYTARQISNYLKSEWRIKPDQSELDQPTV